ncbi:creatinine amidohydrolase [Synechococcus sp. MEDNS5]|uniref:creatininase family protein n=1 Tax=Synechococcus sp. MEDNS5 TaxID=1442554 RepID=UPI00164646ED|nr:creatininase family protein [Synechococcus sp. MEDNS5]QNJ05419.1 creatinine amidohydrolase [Synechococcus sp. MEDNS5]
MECSDSRRSRRLDHLHWPDAASRLRDPRSTLVWPFGALEQHGPQLPLATDALFAERILSRVLETLPDAWPIWALPPQSIGLSPEHRGFPGTLSLSADLLIRLVVEVGEQLAAQGVKRLVLFNAHGGQIGLLQTAARELAARAPSMAVLPCFLWSGVEGLETLIPSQELQNGLHAGLAETSLMLALAPELVGPERPCDGLQSALPPPDGWSLEGAAPYAWFTADISNSGVVGDSRGADASLGQRLNIALMEHWSSLFSSLMVSDWPPAADARRVRGPSTMHP